MEIIGPEYEYKGGEVHVFDLDGTLINPLAPEFRHSEDISKYVLRNPGNRKLPDHLVIFTNQLRTKHHLILSKLALVGTVAKVTAYVFTADDKWRKPSPCALLKFMKTYSIKPNDIIFIGDAAGRIGDFSDSDRKFALNARVGFMTPEMYFDSVPILDESQKYFLRGFDPTLINTDNVTITPSSNELFEKTMVIIVGPPSSGKSTLATRLYPSYIKVNQDTINCGGIKKGTRPQCLRMAALAMHYGYGVCIDNTNPTASIRAEYIELAKKYKYTIKCAFLNIDRSLVTHLGNCRKILGGRALPTVAYGKYYSIFEYPDEKEGFALSVYGFIPNFSKKQLKVFNYRY